MTLLSNCANCINHCCRRPLISEQEIQNIENKYNITLELSNNETQHLTKIYKNRINFKIVSNGCKRNNNQHRNKESNDSYKNTNRTI